MKLTYIILVFCFLLSANAQRRSGTVQETTSEKSPQATRSRGRTRFTATPDYSEITDTSKKSTSDSTATTRRVVSRKRVNTNTKETATLERRARPSTEVKKPVYEVVEDILNESPIDPYRRQSKPRILTESRFEVGNAAKRPIDTTIPVADNVSPIEELYKDFGATARQFSNRKVPPRGEIVLEAADLSPVKFGSTARSIVSSRRGEVVPPRGASVVTPANDVSFGSTARQILASRGAETNPIAFGNPSRQLVLTKTPEAPILEEIPAEIVFSADLPKQEDNVQEINVANEGDFDTTISSLPAELPREIPTKENNELRNFQPEAPSDLVTEPQRRSQDRRTNVGRSRSSNSVEASVAQASASRTRGRTRSSRRQDAELDASPATRVISKSPRGRRPESATLETTRTRGPSVFTEDAVGEISRTRTGRRIGSSSEPEKFTIDLTAAQSVQTRTRASARRVPTTEASAPTVSSRRRGGRFSAGITEEPKPARSSGREIPSRSRQTQTKTNSRDPPISRGLPRDIPPREIVRDVALRTGAREIPLRSSRDDTVRSNTREIPPRRSSNSETVTRFSPRDAVVNENRIPETTIRPRDLQRTIVKDVSTTRTTSRAEVLSENDATVVPSTRFREVLLRTNPVTTEITRGRSRYTDTPPVIDEQKLEVLPLFEAEDKIIRPTRKSRSRSSLKKENSLEDSIQTSATETEAKVTTRPVNNNKELQSKVKDAQTTRVTVTRTQSVETKTEASTTSVRTSRPRIKESVVSEINEVTSKRTVSRKRKPSVLSDSKVKSKGVEKKVKTTENEAVAARGTKKSEVNINVVGKKKSSEEEIDESDNYPEPFKALIKSKKGKKDKQQQQGSRPRLLPSGVSLAAKNNNAAEKIVISTSSTASRSTDSPSTVVTRATVKDDVENELIPKPYSSTTPQARGLTSVRERVSPTTKPTIPAKKKKTQRVSEPTKSTKKFSRSTVAPPAQQSSRDPHRFHAKFSSSTTPKNENLNTNASPTVVKGGRSFTPAPPRGLYSSRKENKNEKREEKSVRFTKKQAEPAQVTKSAVAPLKKSSSRYSSRYRNDISTRGVQSKSTTSTPFYIPTIPTAAYVPTVPTITPPYTTVNGGKDRDLGLEVITFDDPVNTIPSANLVNGELLTTDKALKISALVRDGTTEKPVSIIERIINSLTSITTSTAAPNVTTLPTTTTTEATESSAILKLATKKPTTKDKTRQDHDDNTAQKTSSSSPLTLTSEKPTTIIERILSSLTALQNVESNSIQVGNNFNTISSSPTTPLPKYSSKISSSTPLPAPLSSRSTSINPLNVLEEIGEEQLLQKRTIGKLLAILNGLTSTHPPEELVAITPKSTNTLTTNPVEQLVTIYPTKNALTADYTSGTTKQPSHTFPTTLFTSVPATNTPIESRAGFPVTDSTTSSPNSMNSSARFPTTLFTPAPSTSSPNSIDSSATFPTTLFTPASSTSTAASTIFTTVPSDTLSTLKEPGTTIAFKSDTEDSTESQTPTVTSTTEPTRISIFSRLNEVDSPTQPVITQSTPTTEIPSTSSTTDIYSTFFTPPSTLPTLTKFEVSPGSVSVFSANELSNFVTPDDNLFNTVTISGRANFDNTATTDNSVTTAEPTTVAGFTTDGTTFPSGTTDTLITSTTDVEESSTIAFNDADEANTLSPNLSMSVTDTSKQISANNVSNSNLELSSRAGRLLNIVEDPVQNSIEVSTASTTTSTTPDYFIFAVLNNNTILRKRPPTIPNKDTPFLIVGVYPNNTIVRKFPNGTLVPMEQIIRVRGFDTSQNPLPLPEITSNQVTNDLGSAQDSNDQTVDQNRSAQAEPNALSLDIPAGNSTNRNNNVAPTKASSSTSTTTILPSSSTSTTTTVAPSTSTTTTTLAPTTTSTTFRTSTLSFSTGTPSASTQNPTLPTLSELLNGRTVEAFNDLINQSATTKENPNYKTIQVNQTPSFTTLPTTTAGLSTTLAPFTSPSLSESTTTPGAPTTTNRYTSTPVPSSATTPQFLSNRILDNTVTTLKSSVEPFITTTPPTLFPSTTIIPTFLTTLFPSLFKITAAEPPITTPGTFSRQSFPNDILVASTTTRATTIVPLITTKEGTTTEPTTTTTRPTTTTQTSTTTTTRRTTTTERTTTTQRTTRPPTTRRVKTTTTTLEPSTTTNPPTTRIFTTTETIVPSTTGNTAQTESMKEFKKATKLKELTEEQRLNLEAIARLEKEQEALLKQLSFLTSLNFGGANARKPLPVKTPASINNSLANRIISMAVERDRNRSTPKPPNSIQDQLDILEGNKDTQRTPKKSNPSLEEVLKQYNITNVDLPKDTNYGKSEDALLAAILKDQGIGPTTPKALGERIKESGIFEETTTTKKPKPRPRPRPTTQRPPGRLMQGLSWLLNALAPPPLPQLTTRRPRVKKPSVEPELLTNQPTRITPVVTAAPKVAPGVKLSQDDIKSLINQLEEVQKNPKKANDVDFSKIKSLQNLIDINEGVEVISPGQHGATSKATTRTPKATTTITTESTDTPTRRVKSTTAIPISSTSNSLEDDFDFTKPVTVTRPPLVPSLPPLRLNPVPGVDDGEPLIRSNLITAAVNVTRAISSFLGSALQGAAQGFRGLMGAGSSMVGNFAQGSSVSGNNRPG